MKLPRKAWISLISLILGSTVVFWAAKARWERFQAEESMKHRMRNAYLIHQALFAYASSHDGVFPNQNPDGSDFKTSNEAFRQLFVSGLLDDETMFFEAGTPWCVGSKPDGDIGGPEDNYAKAVAPGENFWAYATGQISTGSATSPLLMDGHTAERLNGQPDRRPEGAWDYRVIVWLDGSVKFSPSEEEISALKTGLSTLNILPPALPAK